MIEKGAIGQQEDRVDLEGRNVICEMRGISLTRRITF